MRRLLFLSTLILAMSLGADPGMTRPAHAAGHTPALGLPRIVQGFAVTVRGVERAHQAGGADYVAGRGNIFLLVTLEIQRRGGHGAYLADPQDFHIQTSSGTVIDSEQFGMTNELTARHVYSKPIAGVVGFEVPASDKHLILLWQPNFTQAPDDQATWTI